MGYYNRLGDAGSDAISAQTAQLGGQLTGLQSTYQSAVERGDTDTATAAMSAINQIQAQLSALGAGGPSSTGFFSGTITLPIVGAVSTPLVLAAAAAGLWFLSRKK